MSSLREPRLGPIVGHTTHHSARIWIRGSGTGDQRSNLSESQRSIGVIQVQKADGSDSPRCYYFRLHREFDRTGTIELGVDNSFKVDEPDDPTLAGQPLEPDTEYHVNVSCLVLDDAVDNDTMVGSVDLINRLPHPSVWAQEFDHLASERTTATFRTFAKEKASSIRFLFGSCRYPGPFWKKKRADQIFGPMVNEVLSDNPAQFVLMVGDQIYADKFNRYIPIGLADTFEEFQERYLTAFGSPNMRRLLRLLPNYMILDDHEIEDNWSQDRLHDNRGLFNLAIEAYRSYQWSHGPRIYGEKLFYQFDCNGYPFFVLDVRTQRYNRGSLKKNHLLGLPSFKGDPPSQLETLCAWLKEMQKKRGDIPKFIATTSVFTPNNIDTASNEECKLKSDSWPAYPETRRGLLSAIVKHKIQNVVFLSGDIHNSNVSEITFEGTAAAKALKAFSVTSSAFYWPFPFADGEPSHHVHNSKAPKTRDGFDVGGGVTMHYTARNFTQDDNYCVVDLNQGKHTLTVTVKNKKGRVLTAHDGTPLVSELVLKAWE